jgi:hypothetical protein
VNVAVHADRVALRAVDGSDVVGGPLVRTEQWTPREDVAAVCATPAAVDGVTGFAIQSGPGGLLTPRPPAGAR